MDSYGNLLSAIMESTAWRMEAPRMYGPFHLVFSAALIFLAVSGAIRTRRMSDAGRIRLLAACGWVLAVMEVYKQLFLFCIVNGGVYDWWYFPFQLCSVPMYLCIMLPLITGRDRAAAGIMKPGGLSAAVLTFLECYAFTGAVATFIMPEDILRPYVSLTCHGFIWHGILLFISLTVAMSGMTDTGRHGFARATMLFLGMCVIAVIINVAVEPAMASAHAAGLLPESYAAMFYLNPYHISPQPFVDTIQKSAGIPLGLALYVIAIILASGAVRCACSRLRRGR